MNNEMVKTCPICGEDNDCGLLKDPTQACWCTQKTFPNELLQKVPENMKNKACICQRCVEKFQRHL